MIWVHPRGRRDGPGRALLWVTTPGFLAHFGLDSLSELPNLDELRSAGLLDLAPVAPVAGVPGENSAADQYLPQSVEESAWGRPGPLNNLSLTRSLHSSS
jgi:segregation and condensation protein B